MEGTKFTWGDEALISQHAPEKFRPGERVAVCGMSKIETQAHAAAVGETIGTAMYTVEFEDGSSAEIPEHLLVKFSRSQ